MSKSRLFILGAGASKCYTESLSHLTPPLANEIVDRYNRLDISRNRYVLVGDIVNYARDFRGVSPSEFSQWRDDIERVLTEIDEKIQDYSAHIRETGDWESVLGDTLRLTRAYNQFIFLFASVLNEIQNGPPSRVYCKLCEALTEQDAILTFNWDTLIDRALTETHDWQPADGYGVQAKAVFHDGWNGESPQSGPQCPTYLKLHGSTNWLTAHHQMNLSTGELYSLSQTALSELFIYVHSTSSNYDTYRGRCWGTYEKFSYCYYPPNLPIPRDPPPAGKSHVSTIIEPDLPDHGTVTVNDSTVYSMPVIIPPVRDKKYLRYGSLFETLWNSASKKLQSCRELYMIGYSLPNTDRFVRDFLKEHLLKNPELESFTIIDPHSDQVKQKVIQHLGVSEALVSTINRAFDEETAAELARRCAEQGGSDEGNANGC